MNLKQNGEKSDFYNKLHSAPARRKKQDVLLNALYGLFLYDSSRFHLLLGVFLVCFSLCCHKQLCAAIATKINVFLSMSIQNSK